MFNVTEVKDVYVSKAVEAVFNNLLECALDSGNLFILHGNSGEGKTIAFKYAVHKLRTEKRTYDDGLFGEERPIHFDIIPIESINQEKIEARHISYAIFNWYLIHYPELTKEILESRRPSRDHVKRFIQLYRLLNRRRENKDFVRTLIIIEEGHALTVTALRSLKRLLELSEEYSFAYRTLSIAIVGQNEMLIPLNEATEAKKRATLQKFDGLRNSERIPFFQHVFSRCMSAEYVNQVHGLEQLTWHDLNAMDIGKIARYISLTYSSYPVSKEQFQSVLYELGYYNKSKNKTQAKLIEQETKRRMEERDKKLQAASKVINNLNIDTIKNSKIG